MSGWAGVRSRAAPRLEEVCQGGQRASPRQKKGPARPDRPRRAGAEGAALSGPPAAPGATRAAGSARSRAQLGSSACRGATPGPPAPRPPGASAAQPGAASGPSRPRLRLRFPELRGGAGDGATRRGKAPRGAGMEPSGRPAFGENAVWGPLRLFPAWGDRDACEKCQVCRSAPFRKVFRCKTCFCGYGWFVLKL